MSLTVTLSEDEWQWVMSLVLNSAWIRADPIVKKVEAAVAQPDAAAIQDQAALDEQMRRADALVLERNALRDALAAQDETTRRLEKRLAKREKKQANGHDADRIMELQQALDVETASRVAAEKRQDEIRASLAAARRGQAGIRSRALDEARSAVTVLQTQLARAKDLGYEPESLEQLGLAPPQPPGSAS